MKTQKKPYISIIIPMYNVEKYLRRCLDSVKNQTFKEWQAICVDDGSPDDSGKIAEEYAKKDKRFKVVHKKNGGLSDARNYGMKYTTGKYIMFLDSDDFIHPQTMEITYTLAEQNNSDMVAFTYDRVCDKNKTSVRYNIQQIKYKCIYNALFRSTECYYKHKLFKQYIIKGCQVWKNLYRKSLIKDIKFIKGILFEDFPWWSEVLLKHPSAVLVNLPLYFYESNDESILHVLNEEKTINSVCTGLKHVCLLYEKSTDSESKYFSRNFFWPFLIYVYKIIKQQKNKKYYSLLNNITNSCLFKPFVNFRILRYYKKINNFIK